MGTSMKKIVSYLLIVLVLFFTVIALLGIWEIVDLRHVVQKTLGSLLVVFASSAIVLFIFSVLIKDDNKKN
ncbi:MAG: hypothetical protein JXB49_14900 [Bacteroidales bacterium]|nr:hypothetical protein [Bacteroidales bacterium]